MGVFLVVTPFVLIYAVGYSVDFQRQTLVPAGGIFLKTNQIGIKIFINGKGRSDRKETSFLATGALFNNLRAGLYHVRIEKDGFRPWEKTIEVRRQIVSEYRNIFLVPAAVPVLKQKSVTRIGSLFEYYPSPDGSYTALLFNKGLILTLEKNADSSIVVRKENKTPFQKLVWLDTATLAVQSVGDGSEWRAMEVLPDSRVIETPIRIKRGARFEPVREVLKHPFEAQTFFAVSADGALYRYSGATQKAEKILDQIVYAARVLNRLLFINDKGFFATADLSGNSITLIGRPGVFLGGAFQAFSAPTGMTAIVDGVGGVFLFDPVEQGKVSPLQGAARKVSFNEENTYALLQKQNSLTVLVTLPESEAPFRNALDTIPVLENFPEEILDSTWYSKRYILFSTATGLYGLEFGSGPQDSIIQKISSSGGFLFSDDGHITIVNDKEITVIALE